MKKALVTGAYGYIGSVLCKMLSEQGYYVIGVDSDENAYDENSDGKDYRIKYCEEFMFEDFAHSALSPDVYDLLRDNPDMPVFHLAANSLLGPSIKNPLQYFYNNAASTISMLRWLGPNNNFIFASTAAVYKNDSRTKREYMVPEPPNNYGLSKLMVEQVLDRSYATSKIKAASFRFFNVIGAYGDAGQQPNTPHIVNQLIDKTLQKKQFVVNGNDYDTRDGTCVRDYLHVEDVCRALMHMNRILSKRRSPCHEVYNLGTKTGTSVNEIVDSFKRVTGSKVKVKVGPRRIGDPDTLIADPRKFIDETGFKYKYGPEDLDVMIKSAWDYRNGNF